VALTESKIKDLEDKKFDELYTNHKAKWDTAYKNAAEFAKKHVTHGNDPRPDDVLKVLLPTIEADQDLRDHQEENKGRAKRFVGFFGEYIIDKNL
jgi:hypothetical protein